MVLVLFTAALSVFVFALVGVIAFLDVALREPVAAAMSPREWRAPPQLRGRALYRWFSSTAERVTLAFVAGRRDARTSARLMAAVYEGAGAAPTEGSLLAAATPAFCSTRIAVTPPEAIELADSLHARQQPARIAEIRQQAQENARVLAIPPADGARRTVCCPLACDDGTCLAAGARPVQCRTRCELFGHEIDPVAEMADRASLIAAGAEHGMSRALREAGLDGQLYELNSALAVALSVEDPAGRWASGEAVFAECLPYSAAAARITSVAS